jgi:tetratricopeptide (TPR) repeat protein
MMKHSSNAFRKRQFDQIGQREIAALFTEARYADVERLAGAVTATHGESGLAWKFLGMARVKQGRDGRAALRLAARLLPDDFDAQLFCGYALCCAGEYADAIQALDRALGICPNNAEANFHRANALERLGRLAEAEQSYRHGLTNLPTKPPSLRHTQA